MIKNILTSPRKDGNWETLADEFVRGAKEAGHSVEKVCLYHTLSGVPAPFSLLFVPPTSAAEWSF